MQNELEIVKHIQIPNINIFVIKVQYRTLHLHSDMELNFVLDGETEVVTSAEKHKICKHDLWMLNSNEPHEIKTSAQGITLLCIQLSPKFFDQLLPGSNNIYFDCRSPFSQISKEQKHIIVLNLLDIALSYFNKEQYYQVNCLGLINLLIYNLLNLIPNHTVTDDENYKIHKQNLRLTKLLDFVDKNYTHKIRLQDFAEQENLSLGYLSHFFKDLLHQSFQDYVTSIRLHHATKLLVSSNKSILEIALDSGFSDTRYLYQAFEKHLGTTPLLYRKQENNSSKDFAKIHLSHHSSQQYFTVEKAISFLSDTRTEFINLHAQK